jgi:hypothetical protein
VHVREELGDGQGVLAVECDRGREVRVAEHARVVHMSEREEASVRAPAACERCVRG